MCSIGLARPDRVNDAWPQPQEVDFLTTEDLFVLIERMFGTRHQVRDAGLVDSAAVRPRAVLFGEDVYPGLAGKAAALLHSLVSNHALVDGNKRVGLAGMLLFYGLNNCELVATDDELLDLVMSVADGSLSDIESIAKQLRPWERPAHP
jgi:death-on-curing protein